MKKILPLGALIISLILIFSNTSFLKPTSTPMPSSSPEVRSASTFGKRTKTSGCTAKGGLPDKDCTPGDVITEATKNEICQSGYSSNTRNVPESVKNEVFKEYGITSHTEGEYEVDHLVSLELGGSNDISNLWPELASPKPGFHEKDKVENFLHTELCNGSRLLQDVQLQISENWLTVYKEITPQ